MSRVQNKKKFKEASEIMEIELLDHIIVTQGEKFTVLETMEKWKNSRGNEESTVSTAAFSF